MKKSAMGSPAFIGSPHFVSERLSERAGVEVVVKIESANPIGAFKGRGKELQASFEQDGNVPAPWLHLLLLP